MRDAFLKCMKMLYPTGDVDPHQLRDLVRTFTMGWCEALMSVGDKEAVKDIYKDLQAISAKGWMPGDEWKWWTIYYSVDTRDKR